MRGKAGFTLIELLVVVLIVGLLAAIAVPQYFKVVEKGKFAEAAQWVNNLKSAQERYLSKNGVYRPGSPTAADAFDTGLGTLGRYSASAVTTSGGPGWTITLTRAAPCPALYGCYTVTYTLPPGSLACSQTNCSADLLPYQ